MEMNWRKRLLTGIGLRLQRMGAALVDEPQAQSSDAPPAHWLELLGQSEVPIQWQGVAQTEQESLPLAAPPQALDLGNSADSTPKTPQPTYPNPSTAQSPPTPNYQSSDQGVGKRAVFERVDQENGAKRVDYAKAVHSERPARLQFLTSEADGEREKPQANWEAQGPRSQAQGSEQERTTSNAQSPPQAVYSSEIGRKSTPPPTYTVHASKLDVLLSYLPWRRKRQENSAEFPLPLSPTLPQGGEYAKSAQRPAAVTEFPQSAPLPTRHIDYAKPSVRKKRLTEWQTADQTRQRPFPTYATSQPVATNEPLDFVPSADYWPTLPTHPLLDEEVASEPPDAAHLQKLRREQLGKHR